MIIANAEVAETIERFFYDVGIIQQHDQTESTDKNKANNESPKNTSNIEESSPIDSKNLNADFKICPDCSSKSLKTENGCDMCVECEEDADDVEGDGNK